jgi:hypothetical protein
MGCLNWVNRLPFFNRHLAAEVIIECLPPLRVPFLAMAYRIRMCYVEQLLGWFSRILHTGCVLS